MVVWDKEVRSGMCGGPGREGAGPEGGGGQSGCEPKNWSYCENAKKKK